MASQGTPLWLTLVLVPVTAWIAHLLSVRRDNSNRSKNDIDRWTDKCLDLLAELESLSLQHYLDPNQIAMTAHNSSVIVSKFKLLETHFKKVQCVDGDKSKVLRDAKIRLRNAVTLPVDFDQTDRVARTNNDPEVLEIQNAFDDCRGALDLKMTVKPRR